MRLAAAALVCLFVASCGGGDSSVDWSGVPTNQRIAIEDAVKAKDCTRMQTYFDGSTSADVLEFIDRQMKRAGCY